MKKLVMIAVLNIMLSGCGMHYTKLPLEAGKDDEAPKASLCIKKKCEVFYQQGKFLDDIKECEIS